MPEDLGDSTASPGAIDFDFSEPFVDVNDLRFDAWAVTSLPSTSSSAFQPFAMTIDSACDFYMLQSTVGLHVRPAPTLRGPRRFHDAGGHVHPVSQIVHVLFHGGSATGPTIALPMAVTTSISSLFSVKQWRGLGGSAIPTNHDAHLLARDGTKIPLAVNSANDHVLELFPIQSALAAALAVADVAPSSASVAANALATTPPTPSPPPTLPPTLPTPSPPTPPSPTTPTRPSLLLRTQRVRYRPLSCPVSLSTATVLIRSLLTPLPLASTGSYRTMVSPRSALLAVSTAASLVGLAAPRPTP